jgi:trimeric autotransporter adhesin
MYNVAVTSRQGLIAARRECFVGRRLARLLCRAAVVFALLMVGLVAGVPFAHLTPASASDATFVDIPRPVNGHAFGDSVLVLSNGNYVITDPYTQNSTGPSGAVYLYDGKTNQIISTLKGLEGNSGRLFEVGASNFVVVTPNELNGAITWVNGTTGLDGVISAANSMTNGQDPKGLFTSVTNLTNGNYVVSNGAWETSRGYARWAPGNAPATGAIGAANSAVGKTAGDSVAGVVPLTNGNYVISASGFDLDLGVLGTVSNAGAVVWGNGASGFSGELTGTNSLYGWTDDHVGSTITPLTNGNYVVGSPSWHAGSLSVGAATWASGTTGIVGPVDSTNSLIGSSPQDGVGLKVLALSNGHYVVASCSWSNGLTPNVGAVTWGDGTSGKVGVVSASDSLIGTSAGDCVGQNIAAAANGNYVISSSLWGPTDLGAATWVNGSGPTVGVVSAANSLVGSSPGDGVGNYLVSLSDGDVVVPSGGWDNGSVVDAGAATWMSGSSPTVGVVSASNSVVGSHPNDYVGTPIPLVNGEYAVASLFWDNGSATDAGAIRLLPGTGPSSGPLTPDNSLVGSRAGDRVGEYVKPNPVGGFIAGSSRIGVTTFSQPASPTVGVMSPSNSVVGVVDSRLLTFDDGSAATFSDPVVVFNRGNVGPASTLRHVPRTPESTSGRNEAQVGTRRTASGAILVGRPWDPVATLVYAPGPDNVPLAPARLADTRPGGSTIDGRFAAEGTRPAGSTYEVQVVGRGGVPADASAVGLNVTVTAAAGDGFATVYPCGEPLPVASNLNFLTNGTVPNAVLAKVGSGGKVCLFVSQATQLIVDVGGFVPLRSSYSALNPARLLDTRPLGSTVDGIGARAGLRPAGSITAIQVNRGGVATDASAVVLNVTATDATADGFVTVFPCGTDVPVASNLNFRARSAAPNMVISKIGISNNVCLYNSAATHLIVDVNGYLQPAAWYRALVPTRLVDTRSVSATVDGQQSGGGPVAGGSVTVVKVVGRANVVGDATAIALNVTVVDPVDAGFATVYPCGGDPPLASNLNFVPGGAIPNAVITKIGSSGTVCVYTSSKTQLIVDVNGYYYD